MALEIDTMSAFRGASDLRRLVHAVLTAGDHDEADWVEWKSKLDLSTKEDRFHIVKAVLGIANRMPEQAALTCEGVGYIVVGAEPGNVGGIESIDLADLEQGIEVYLGGSKGPRFTLSYIAVDGNSVLVVTVEAPKAGQHIFTLRKEISGGHRSGTVFIRRHARTLPADASDLDALQNRLLAGSHAPPKPELQVTLVGDVPMSWIDASDVTDVVDRWVAEKHNELIERARTVERKRKPSVPPEAGPEIGPIGDAVFRLSAQQAQLEHAGSLGLGIAALLGTEDERTLDEYIAEVADWSEMLKNSAIEALPALYFEGGHGVMAVQVHNPTGRFLSNVEVIVHFEWEGATGYDRRPGGAVLPPPPRPYGDRTPPRMGLGNRFVRPPRTKIRCSGHVFVVSSADLSRGWLGSNQASRWRPPSTI